MAATILPTHNTAWGFWGTCVHAGWDAEALWAAVSADLAARFGLDPATVRDLLDASFGRHLADDLTSIDGGPHDLDALAAHLDDRFAQPGWSKWVRLSVGELRR